MNRMSTASPNVQVVLTCFDPATRDAMEQALHAYAKHRGIEYDSLVDAEPSIYSFAYWLYRYSGLIMPNPK